MATAKYMKKATNFQLKQRRAQHQIIKVDNNIMKKMPSKTVTFVERSTLSTIIHRFSFFIKVNK